MRSSACATMRPSSCSGPRASPTDGGPIARARGSSPAQSTAAGDPLPAGFRAADLARLRSKSHGEDPRPAGKPSGPPRSALPIARSGATRRAATLRRCEPLVISISSGSAGCSFRRRLRAPCAGAVAAAAAGHPIDGRRYGLGQACVSAFQLMTHYANDYFDFETDSLQIPHRPGGPVAAGAREHRAAASRRTGRRDQLRGARPRLDRITACHGGPWTLRSWSRSPCSPGVSAPPLRLCASRPGRARHAIVVTALVPLLAFYLRHPISPASRLLALAAVSPFLLQVRHAACDRVPDAAAAPRPQRTLVRPDGAARSAWLYVAITAAAFAWLPLASPSACRARRAVRRDPGAVRAGRIAASPRFTIRAPSASDLVGGRAPCRNLARRAGRAGPAVA